MLNIDGQDPVRKDLGRARRPEEPGEPALLYVDLHLVHEVTSPQAFDGLRLAGRAVRRPELTVATMDHNVPTTDRGPIADAIARAADRRAARRTARSSASSSTRPAVRQPGHRARDRAGARADPAGHDDRVRRLATPRRTARSARSPSASAPPRSSTCSPPRRCRSAGRKTMQVESTAVAAAGVTPRTSSSAHRPDRHRRRRRPRRRVHRRGDPRASRWRAA